MSIAVIASQQAITASPISAATVALLAMLADYKITLLDILKVSPFYFHRLYDSCICC